MVQVLFCAPFHPKVYSSFTHVELLPCSRGDFKALRGRSLPSGTNHLPAAVAVVHRFSAY